MPPIAFMIDAGFFMKRIEQAPEGMRLSFRETRLRRRLPLLTASLFALFHVAAVVLPLVWSRGSGEGQAFLVAVIDYPLLKLLEAVPGGSHILYDSSTMAVLFFSVVGTLMYAAAGYCLGLLIRALIAVNRPETIRR